MKNAIGLIELSSIAKGYEVTDELVKAADSQLVEAHSVCPGKFIVLITGLVGDVEKSVDAGLQLAGHSLVQKL
ncbi:MAG: BMC domain-containing protein, partial [bacterium]